jgi:hypothetical protein
MPISSTVDYIPVMDEFLAHWASLDESVVLSEDNKPISMQDFSGLRQDLDRIKSVLQSRLNDLELARVKLEDLRQKAGDRIAEFNRRVRAEFPNKGIFSRLPAVPARTAGRDAFLDAMDDVLDLWNRANQLPPTPVFTAPLRLMGGLTRESFEDMRAELDKAFTGRGAAEAGAFSQRFLRNSLQDRVKSLMVLYRMKIEGLYAPDSRQVATLPRVTPLPGSTPDAVEAKGQWNSETQRAEITWTASEDPDLASYQIRSVPGPDYSSDDESLMATIPPTGPLAWQNGQGLAVPGSIMSYKVYVRLSTGNEAGSEAIAVLHPK